MLAHTIGEVVASSHRPIFLGCNMTTVLPMTCSEINDWGDDERGCDQWDWLPGETPNARRNIKVRECVGRASSGKFSELSRQDKSRLGLANY